MGATDSEGSSRPLLGSLGINSTFANTSVQGSPLTTHQAPCQALVTDLRRSGRIKEATSKSKDAIAINPTAETGVTPSDMQL